MDELDKFLNSLDLNLDGDEDGELVDSACAVSIGGTSGYRRESALEREKRTESILRHDLVAPHIVQFSSSSSNSRKKFRRALAGFLVLALSVTGLIRSGKGGFSISHEAALDIEYKMEAVSFDLNATTSKDLTEDAKNSTRAKS